MANVNRVILIGNLTRDPQLKYLPSQTAVAEFGLAINRKYKSASGEAKEDVCFVDCTAFGRTGEVINQYCQKGKQIYIEGRLKYDSWEDKQGGGKRSKLGVVVENFQFLGGRESGAGPNQEASGGGTEDQTAPPARPQRNVPPPARAQPPAQPAQSQEPPFGEEQQFREDEIPF
jgi:single-strand DNA-binding protein